MGKIFCLSGFSKDYSCLNGIQRSQCDKKLYSLRTGRAKLAALKGYKGIYKIYVDGGTRILLAQLEHALSGEMVTVVIGLVLDHRYDRVKVLLENFLRNFREGITPDLQRAIEESDFEKVEEDEEEEEASTEEPPLEWQEVEYYNHQFIILNEQQLLTRKTPWPSVIIGTPGTGKTTMLMFNLLQRAKEILRDKGTVKGAFVAPTEELAKRLTAIFWSLLEAQDLPPGSVQFYSRDAFFRHIILKKESEQEKEVEQKWEGEATFQQWFKKYVQAEKRHYRHKGKKSFLNLSASVVYQELRYFNGLPLQQWQLGHRHSLQTDEETTTWLFNTCEKYKNYLKDEKKIDPVLYELPQEQVSTFDCLAVDEGQTANYTEVVRSLKLSNKNVLLAYNNMQRLEGDDPLLPLLERTGIFHCVKLNTGYRCPELVLAVVRKFLQMETLLAGTEPEFLQIAKELEGKPGKVQLVFAEEEKQMEVLRQLAQSPNLAIITQPDRVATVSQTFGTPLVFSAQSGIGLNFTTVVLDSMLDQAIFREASGLLEGQVLDKLYGRSGKGDPRFAKAFNGLIVGATRSEENLIIVGKRDKRLDTIYHHLQEITAQSQAVLTTSSPKQATPADWQKMHDRLKEEGFHTQADAVEKMYLTQENALKVEEIKPSANPHAANLPTRVTKDKRRRGTQRLSTVRTVVSAAVPEKAPANIVQLFKKYEGNLKQLGKTPNNPKRLSATIKALKQLLDQKEAPQLLFKWQYLSQAWISLLPNFDEPCEKALWQNILRDNDYRLKIKSAMKTALERLDNPQTWFLLTTMHNLECVFLVKKQSLLAELISENPELAKKVTGDMISFIYMEVAHAMHNLCTSLGCDLVTQLFNNNPQLEQDFIRLLLSNGQFAAILLRSLAKHEVGREWLYNWIVRNINNPLIYHIFFKQINFHPLFANILRAHEDLYSKIPYDLLWQLNVAGCEPGLNALCYLSSSEEGNAIMTLFFDNAPAFRESITAERLSQKIARHGTFLLRYACNMNKDFKILEKIFEAKPALISQIPVACWLNMDNDRISGSVFYFFTIGFKARCLKLVLENHTELQQSITADILTRRVGHYFSSLINFAVDEDSHENFLLLLRNRASLAAELKQGILQLLEKNDSLPLAWSFALLFLATTDRGIACLKYLIESNTELVDALTVDILTRIEGTDATTKTSLLNNLSLTKEGVEIIELLFAKKRELIAQIPVETLFLPLQGFRDSTSCVFVNLIKFSEKDIPVNPLRHFTADMEALTKKIVAKNLFISSPFMIYNATPLYFLAINHIAILQGIIRYNPKLLQQITLAQSVCFIKLARNVSLLECLSATEEGCETLCNFTNIKPAMLREVTVKLLSTYINKDKIILDSLLSNASGILFLQKVLKVNTALGTELMNLDTIKVRYANNAKFLDLINPGQTEVVSITAPTFFSEQNTKQNSTNTNATLLTQ